MSEEQTPTIDRSIYVMPMFTTLVVQSLAASEAFFHQVGFITLATILGPSGAVQLMHLRRMRNQDILLTEVSPVLGSTSTTFAAGGADLAELATRISVGNDVSVEGPIDTPWFTTDLRIVDADGNRIILTSPRTADLPAAMGWVRENISGDFDAPTGFDRSQWQGRPG
jgi:hypothetical protein